MRLSYSVSPGGLPGNPQVTGQASAQQWPKLPSSSPWSGLPPDEPNRDDPPRDASVPPLDMPRFRREPAKEETNTPSAGGRFAVDEPYIVGTTAIPAYPPAPSQGGDRGQEPPLGDANPAFDPNPERGAPPFSSKERR